MSSLIWVYTIFLVLPVRKLRIIMAALVLGNPVSTQWRLKIRGTDQNHRKFHCCPEMLLFTYDRCPFSCNKQLKNIGWSHLLEYKWATSWQNLLLPYRNNKGTDQPAHLLPWMRTPVCVLPDHKPRRQVFSWRGLNCVYYLTAKVWYTCTLCTCMILFTCNTNLCLYRMKWFSSFYMYIMLLHIYLKCFSRKT